MTRDIVSLNLLIPDQRIEPLSGDAPAQQHACNSRADVETRLFPSRAHWLSLVMRANATRSVPLAAASPIYTRLNKPATNWPNDAIVIL